MNKHTPLPLRIQRNAESEIGFDFMFELGVPILTEEEYWDTAEFIVRAANSHDDLVSACEFALAVAEGRVLGGTWDDVMLEMRRVLPKATGEQP
jgi:thiamine phosphate synthase YjbQ (UPF0047 family)